MIVHIFLILSWLIICLLEGTRDAFFYHNKMSASNPDKYNVHWIFFIERAVTLSLIFLVDYTYYDKLFNTSLFALSLILIFSFIHNGIYFTIRHKLNNSIYLKKWWSNSYTSTALIELNTISRAFLFFTGIIGIITTFIYL